MPIIDCDLSPRDSRSESGPSLSTCSASRSDSASLGGAGEFAGWLVALWVEECGGGVVGEHVGAEVLGGEGLGG